MSASFLSSVTGAASRCVGCGILVASGEVLCACCLEEVDSHSPTWHTTPDDDFDPSFRFNERAARNWIMSTGRS